MVLMMKAWRVAVPLQTTRGARQGRTPRETVMIFWVDSVATVWLEVEERGANFLPLHVAKFLAAASACHDYTVALCRLSLQAQHTHYTNKVERTGWFI
jgi:hypothetical protein